MPPESHAGDPALACGRELREEPVSARTVLTPYSRLFAVPGAARFSFAGWMARVPASTLGLGTVLLVAGETGSYALAGAVSGTLALAFAAASPLWARAADRRGQSPVLGRAIAAFVLLNVAFLVVVLAGAPVWSWFVLAAGGGASAPNIGSLVRARWAHALPDAGQRQTAFAFESVVDEVVFVVGPPLVTFLAALVSPAAGFVTGLVLGGAGGIWLARQVATAPPAHPAGHGTRQHRWAALPPAAVVVTVCYLAVGTVFGAVDVVVVGFAQAQGRPAMSGVVLACFAGGSLVAGLLYGVVRLPGSLAARFVGCVVLFGLAVQLMHAAGSVAVLVPISFVAGLTISPVLVSGMSLVESRVPRSALTEALTWTNTGLTAGVTVGATLAGAAVDAWGAQAAFAVPSLGAGLAGLLALAALPLLLRRPLGPVAAERVSLLSDDGCGAES